jgi:hypothetical protein
MLDAFGQTLELSWPGLAGGVEHEHLIIRPFILGDQRASTMWSALDAALPGVAWHELLALRGSLSHLVVVLGSDGCSANLRMRSWAILQALL